METVLKEVINSDEKTGKIVYLYKHEIEFRKTLELASVVTLSGDVHVLV